jgi:drug/metabolite transporter (DMT)-like permease
VIGALLGLVAALAYGSSDFVAGVAGRRSPVLYVTAVTLVVGFVFGAVTLVFAHGSGPASAPLLWGAISGVGSALGTLALYQGFAVGSMSVVATVSGVLTVAIPAVVGVAIGNRLSPLGVAGVIAAIVAVALVSWAGGGLRAGGALYGVGAGAGFALLFIALERAGTAAGVWPVVTGQLVACLVIAPFLLVPLWRGGTPSARTPARGSLRLPALAGVLAAVAAIAYSAGTGEGELVVIAVITSMYPAVTVLLARIVLKERWSRLQSTGLVLSAASVAVIALS